MIYLENIEFPYKIKNFLNCNVMNKVIRSMIDNALPVDFSREDWKMTTRIEFKPYFRRKSALEENLDNFMIELRNLSQISSFPEYTDLLRWCLFTYRSVLHENKADTYKNMNLLFPNLGKSDDRWMNIFQVSTQLQSDAATQDKVFQIFETLDRIAEGCLKPQLQVLYAFAVKKFTGLWPEDVHSLDFGALVAKFPKHTANKFRYCLTTLTYLSL